MQCRRTSYREERCEDEDDEAWMAGTVVALLPRLLVALGDSGTDEGFPFQVAVPIIVASGN